MAMVRSHGALLLLLAGAAVAWDPTPNYEMAPCYPDQTGGEACHFIPGSKTEWSGGATDYTVSADGSYGAPLYDSVDTEWSKKYVDNVHIEMGSVPGKLLREQIVNGEVRIGRAIDEKVGRGNLFLPLPGNFPPGSSEYTGPQEYLEMLHPDKQYSRTIYLKDSTGEEIEVGPIDMRKAMRSGGFPMCPNYWDHHGGDNPGPLNLATDNTINQNGELYKFPNKVVGSPLVGDPELHFCRKWQEKYDATCCNTWLDEDIQEEYEELTGSGYLGAHVFVQQFLCLPCHPMISCMIDEHSNTLRIPLEFAKKLADKLEDFDRTGLKVKFGEHDDDLGPLRQDELIIPAQHFSQQRGTGGGGPADEPNGPAPPFPVPNCAGNLDELFAGVEVDPANGDLTASSKTGYWHEDDCTQETEDYDEDGEERAGLSFPPDDIGRCECTGPGKHCACIREFLLHLRPPGINGYDGYDLNIEIVDDDSCGVLYDLMAGSMADPLLEVESSAAFSPAQRLSLSMLAAGMVLTILQIVR